MKKSIIAFLLLVFVGSVNAQSVYQLQDVRVKEITIKEGRNSFLSMHGNGTLEFVKSGERFTDIQFKDAKGRFHKLTEISPTTPGLPKPECEPNSLDLNFASANNQYGFHICRMPETPGSKLPVAGTLTFMTPTGADKFTLRDFKLGQ